jgi:hypothetical protein
MGATKSHELSGNSNIFPKCSRVYTDVQEALEKSP